MYDTMDAGGNMTKSVKSIKIIVRLDLQGHDLSQESIESIIQNMDYQFIYEDTYAKIIDSEVIEVI